MIKVKLLLIVSCFLPAILCVAQVSSSLEKDKVIKEITLPSFETVVVKGGGDLYFHYSPNTKAEIKETGPCVQKISVEVSSGTLSIRPQAGYLDNCRFEIHIFTPIIKEIQQNGGGSIVIEKGFKPLDAFKCKIDGGGNIKMEALKVDYLRASIMGGGEITAQVSKKIDGKIRGGGVIFYQGDPVIVSDISGGGVIKRK